MAIRYIYGGVRSTGVMQQIFRVMLEPVLVFLFAYSDEFRCICFACCLGIFDDWMMLECERFAAPVMSSE